MTSIPTQFSTFGKTAVMALAVASTSVLAINPAPALADHHAAPKTQNDIVATAMSTGVHTTLVAAVKAAGLVETLQGDGPFTVFAPTDTAFAKLPEGTVATLVKPENKGTLTTVLTYHAVAGKVTAGDLVQLIKKHGGSYMIKTLSGATLEARLSGETVVITDGKGRATAVTQTDVMTSNGVIHVTDGVFLPA